MFTVLRCNCGYRKLARTNHSLGSNQDQALEEDELLGDKVLNSNGFEVLTSRLEMANGQA